MRQAGIYAPEWPNKATFYVGPKGTLPKVGDAVSVLNFHDHATRHATVTQRNRRRHEYTALITKGIVTQYNLWDSQTVAEA